MGSREDEGGGQLIPKAFSTCSLTCGCWETKRQRGSSRAWQRDRPRPVSPPTCALQNGSSYSPPEPEAKTLLPSREHPAPPGLQKASVLRPATDLRSKLAMLAPLLHPGDAGLVLYLAEQGSHTASLFTELVPHPGSTHEPLRLRHWVQGLGRQQLNRAKIFCPPAQTAVSSTATPATTSQGREALAKDTDPPIKPARLLHLPPRTRGSDAVIQRGCKQTKRGTERQRARHRPRAPPASTLTFSVSPCCCLPGSGKAHPGFRAGNPRG